MSDSWTGLAAAIGNGEQVHTRAGPHVVAGSRPARPSSEAVSGRWEEGGVQILSHAVLRRGSER